MPVYLATQADDPFQNGGARFNQPDPGAQRGLNVFHVSELQSVTGNNREGAITTAHVQVPMFALSPFEREEIAKLNSFVLGIVSGRMNRIGGVDWEVSRKIKGEDEIAEQLKSLREIFTENDDLMDTRQLMTRRLALQRVREELPDIMLDMSNFDKALRRWNRRMRKAINKSKQEVEDWVNQPNPEDDFEEYRKKWVFDLMVHGASATYKMVGSVSGIIESIHVLPGGSVLPLRTRYVSASSGYAQLIPGFTPSIYYKDEIAFDRYIPASNKSYGLVPLDALVNKVAEALLFDRFAADRADGTKPPEKMVLFGTGQNPFGDISTVGQFNTPLPAAEQKRMETKVNTARKEAIAVMSGLGSDVTILDLSKADTFGAQAQRQEQLLKDIALVYNVTNNEINLTGSEGTSGRSTSETQERIDRDKGIGPILRIIDRTMTTQVLPFRFGPGWEFKHDEGMTEREQVMIDTLKLTSGGYGVNEIREARGDDPVEGEVYDNPPAPGAITPGGDPGGSLQNPLFMSNVDA